MKNPLLPFSVKVFMNRFETKLKNTCVNFLKVWVRYVYDIFAVVDKDFIKEVFIQNVNLYYSSIKFTYKHEVTGKLPFLDLLIKKVGKN